MRGCWPLLSIGIRPERARNKFIEIQMLVDALDRAISGAEIISPRG